MDDIKRVNVNQQLEKLKSLGVSLPQKKVNPQNQLEKLMSYGVNIPQMKKPVNLPEAQTPATKRNESWWKKATPLASQTRLPFQNKKFVQDTVGAVTAAAPEVLTQIASQQADDFNNYQQSAAKTEAAEKTIDDVIKYYGGKKNSDGSVSFPSQQGIDEYNKYRKAYEAAYQNTENAYHNLQGSSEEYDRALGAASDAQRFIDNISNMSDEELKDFADKQGYGAYNRYTAAERTYKDLIAKRDQELYALRKEYGYGNTNTKTDNPEVYATEEYLAYTQAKERSEWLLAQYGEDDPEYKQAVEEENTAKELYESAKANAGSNAQNNPDPEKNHEYDQRAADIMADYAPAIEAAEAQVNEAKAALGSSKTNPILWQIIQEVSQRNWSKGYEAYKNRIGNIDRPSIAKLESAEDWSYFASDIQNQPDFEKYSYVYKGINPNEGTLYTYMKPWETGWQTYRGGIIDNSINIGWNDPAFAAVNKLPTQEGAQGLRNVHDKKELFLSSDEIKVYNYLYQNPKYGKEYAEKYLESIEDLVFRHATGIADAMDAPGLRELENFMVGGRNAFYGAAQHLSKEALPTDAMEIAAAMLQERHKGGLAYYTMGAAQSIGNMAPSLLVSAATGQPWLGAVTMGVTSSGSATRQALQNGMSQGQARTYGLLVGTAEGGLQYALGGIGKLGGKLTGGFVDRITAGISNSAAKVAVKFGGSMASELLEENLQNYLEPAFQMIVGATDQYDAPGMDEFIDTTLTTMMTTGLLESGNVAANYQIAEFEKNEVKPWIEKALTVAKEGSAVHNTALELQNMLKKGEAVTPKVFMDAVSKISEANKVEHKEAVLMSEQEQTEYRAEQVQAANPEAEVITSASVQSYLDSGVSLPTATSAAEVLDKIIAGEISSEELSNNNIDKLQLHIPNMARVASKVLGIDIPKITTKSEARNEFRKAIREYEAKKALQNTTGETSVASDETIPQSSTTVVPESDNSLQAETEPHIAVRVRPVKRTATKPIDSSATETRKMEAIEAERPAGMMPYRDFSNELIGINRGKIDGNTGISLYNLFEEAIRNGMNAMSPAAFANTYRADNAKAKPSEILTAYQGYLENISSDIIGYPDFAEQYKQEHPDATMNEIALAYQDYLNGDAKHDMKQTEQYGVIEDEYSAQVEAQFVEAVDALAKLFKTNIRFADLGEDNGKFDPKANEILLDINPDKMFTQVAGHEIGHQLRKKISKAAWANFENYAVKAMGGDAAVKAKQNFHKAYAKAEVAREEVACDFVGKLLSDKNAMKDFCYAVEHKQVRSETAKWLINACKWFVGKFTNQPKKAEASLIKTVKKTFGTDIETATNAIKALQTAYQEATKSDALRKTENTTNEGGVKHSVKENETKSQLNIDNAEQSSYNNTKNGGQQNGRQQNDGNRMVGRMDQGISLRRNVDSGRTSEREVGRRNQDLPRKHLNQSLNKAFNESGVVATELYDYSGDSAAYSHALDVARLADEKNGWCVTPQTAEDLEGKTLRMDAAHSIGYVLADGDIEGVFKNPKSNTTRRALNGLIPQAVSEGGNKLDCYGEDLVRIYESYGFIPVARVEFNPEYANPGWDESKGRPNIYMMMHNGDSAETVVSKIGQYQHMPLKELEALPLFDKNSYDDAAKYRDELLAKTAQNDNQKKYDKKTMSDADFFETKEGNSLLEKQGLKAKEPFRIPTKAEADALSAKIAKREAQREAERIKRRDEIMTKSVREAPANKKRAEKRGAEKKRSGKTTKELVAKYGAIKKGEKPARDVSVPVSADGKTKVSKLARTAMEAKVTPDEAMPMFEDNIMEGMFSYKPEKNAKQIQKAETRLGSVETRQAYDSFIEASGKGKLKKEDVADGIVLYQRLCAEARAETDAKKKDEILKDATTVLAKLSALVRKGAQITQMARMIKKLDPNMQYYALEKVVLDLQKTLDKRFKDKAPKIEIPKDLADRWLKALKYNDEVEIETCRQLLYEGIAEQVPTQWRDKFNAWRYLAMLGNPKTIIRNAAGNAFFTPVKALKDRFGAAIELVTLDKSKRTKYLGLPNFTKKGKALLKFAEQDYATLSVQETIDQMSIGKYSDKTDEGRLSDAIREKNSKFNMPVLKQWQKLTDWAMNDAKWISDKWFMTHHFKSSFAQAAMARGYSADQLTDGSVSQSELDYLRAYAVKQALMATYRDANAVSNVLTKMRFKGDSFGSAVGNLLIGGALPFRGTPANIAVRAVEYSPLSLLKSISKDIYKLQTGDISGAEYIENLSRGLSGSAIFFIGWLLSSLGILRTGADEDDEREGRQGYSLEIGGISITLDWLAPESIPFFMGAETQKLFAGTSDAESLFEGIGNAFEPMLEFSMLSGINDMISTAFSVGEYGKAERDAAQIATGICLQPFFSYLGQYLPTMLSQTARTIESNRKQTYLGDIEDRFLRTLARMGTKLVEKVPGISDLVLGDRRIDYIDNYGRKESTEHWAVRIVNNFINPAYVSKIDATDVDTEIRRLEEMTGDEISPDRRGYTITIYEYDANGNKTSKEVRLDVEQYEQYQTEYGRQYLLMTTALVMSDEYVMMSNADQVEAFKEIETLANVYGKMAAGVGYEPEINDSNNALYNLYTKANIPISEAYALRLTKSQLDKDDHLTPEQRKLELAEMINGVEGWSDEQRQAAYIFALEPSAPEIGDAEYTDEQKSAFETTYGMYIDQVYSSILSAPEFEDAESDVKADMLSQATDLARFYAKRDWAIENGLSSDSYDPETDKNKYDTVMQAGVSFFDVYAMHQKKKELDAEEKEGAKKALLVVEYKDWLSRYGGLTKKQQAVAQEAFGERGYWSPVDSSKYDAFRSHGISTSMYIAYYNAKNTVGDKNGSWTKEELVEWLNRQPLTNSQRRFIFSITNKNWNNPY